MELTDHPLNPNINEFIEKQRYRDHIRGISMHIGTLEKEIHRPSKNFNIPRMNSAFDDILNDLQDLDTRAKLRGGRNG